MALVNCPECGREKVSDTAESCPDCGYNIKAFFEDKAAKEQLLKWQREQEKAQQKKEEENLKNNEKKISILNIQRKKKIDEIKEMEMPKKPTFISNLFKNGVNGGGAITWIILLTLIISFLIGAFADSHLFLLIFVLLLLFGVPFWSYICWLDYKSELNRYNEIVSDFDHYKQEKIKAVENEYDRKINNIKLYGSENEPSRTYSYRPTVNTPKCPTCGSTNIKKIGTVNRAASVYAAGLASSKIGKQFECKNCGYKW